jgi:hypothetical protein
MRGVGGNGEGGFFVKGGVRYAGIDIEANWME